MNGSAPAASDHRQRQRRLLQVTGIVKPKHAGSSNLEIQRVAPLRGIAARCRWEAVATTATLVTGLTPFTLTQPPNTDTPP